MDVSTSDLEIGRLAARVGERLQQAQLTVITVESCTGGWIAKALTDVPGSSAWFETGLVTYANAAKQHWVEVPEETLGADGAVSAQTVEAMALGALRAWPRAQVSVSVSGVAGPGGGSAEKPVGLVWFGFGDARHGQAGPTASSESRNFEGNRNEVRIAAVLHALAGIDARI